MNDHELSFTTPESLLVTWKIPIFFHLSKNNACFLLSPRFKFVGDSFRLRLFRGSGQFNIALETATNNAPVNDVSYEIGLKSVTGKEIEIDRVMCQQQKQIYYFSSAKVEDERQTYFSDGNITVFCCMRMRGPSSAENPVYTKAEIQNLVENYGFYLSSFAEPYGELSFESPRSLHVLWKIPNFFELTEQYEYSRKSPEFSFGDDRYCLRLFQSRQSGQKRVSFKLVNVLDGLPKTDVSYEVGLNSSTGKEIGIYRNIPTGQLTLTQPVPSLAQFLLDREFFADRQYILKSLQYSAVPVGPLTVFCSLRLREPNNAGDRTSDEEEQERLAAGMAKLQSDLRELLKKKLESDATLVVGEKEFPAHKSILRVRSSVFEAMFGHEMSEKESGRVVIDDLDPETFGCFLEYLYTGVVGAGLSDNNVFELYKAAHKYNVPTLKSECVAHVRRNMSVDFFCEAVSLALLYKEQELFQKAVEFFQRNMEPIILTAKWQQFMIENGAFANEVLVKAITLKRQ